MMMTREAIPHLFLLLRLALFLISALLLCLDIQECSVPVLLTLLSCRYSSELSLFFLFIFIAVLVSLWCFFFFFNNSSSVVRRF